MQQAIPRPSRSAIESWLDLARLIDELVRQQTTWIFRGEPSTTNELRPAAGREGRNDPTARTIRYDVESERAALRRFRHDALPYDPDQHHDPFSIAEVSIYRPRHIDARISAQRSVFTVHPDPTVAFANDRLQRWTVSQAACREVKVVLDACAINYASMFPDVHGLARHVGWRYKWGISQGPMPG